MVHCFFLMFIIYWALWFTVTQYGVELAYAKHVAWVYNRFHSCTSLSIIISDNLGPCIRSSNLVLVDPCCEPRCKCVWVSHRWTCQYLLENVKKTRKTKRHPLFFPRAHPHALHNYPLPSVVLQPVLMSTGHTPMYTSAVSTLVRAQRSVAAPSPWKVTGIIISHQHQCDLYPHFLSLLDLLSLNVWLSDCRWTAARSTPFYLYCQRLWGHLFSDDISVFILIVIQISFVWQICSACTQWLFLGL